MSIKGLRRIILFAIVLATTLYFIPIPALILALLWQIYSRCFSSLIQDRQYGHR